MSMWQISQACRAVAAVTAAVALTLTLAGCGGDDDTNQNSGASSPAKEDSAGKQPSSTSQVPETVIATLKGQKDITLDLTSAVRDSGGFVTVKGVLKNSGDQDFYETSVWSGTELDVKKGAGGSSLAGASLVDKNEKKRYYVLRDTENRPLVTTGLPTIKAKSETPVFMQFPAPPKSTTDVDFQIPTFASTTLELTGE